MTPLPNLLVDPVYSYRVVLEHFWPKLDQCQTTDDPN
jgi:cbb3-type cytochrome oxidase subunit 1